MNEEKRTDVLHYEGGIRSYCEFLLEKSRKEALHDDIVYIEGKNTDDMAEIAFQYNNGYDTKIVSFANDIHTVDGGTHEQAFKTALTRVLNNYARKFKILKENDANLKGEDVQEGIIAIISVKLKNAQFEGQTKAKLGNTSMGTLVNSIMTEKLTQFLEDNPTTARIIIDKAMAASNAREAAQKQGICSAARRGFRV